MVAYNFQKQFVDPIRSGNKTHTIRRNGKRRHARPGERLQIYTGQRTRACEKVIEDPICLAVNKIRIVVGPEQIELIEVDGGKVDDIEQFAVDDGFPNAHDMHEFWLSFHGIGVFVGSMIEWGPVAPK